MHSRQTRGQGCSAGGLVDILVISSVLGLSCESLNSPSCSPFWLGLVSWSVVQFPIAPSGVSPSAGPGSIGRNSWSASTHHTVDTIIPGTPNSACATAHPHPTQPCLHKTTDHFQTLGLGWLAPYLPGLPSLAWALCHVSSSTLAHTAKVAVHLKATSSPGTAVLLFLKPVHPDTCRLTIFPYPTFY